LPGANGTLPLTWLFVLLSILELTPQETMLLTGGASLAQYFWLPREDRRAAQVLFDIGLSVVASAVAVRLFHSEWLLHYQFDQAGRLAVAAFGMFLAGSIPSALVRAYLNDELFLNVWRTKHLWALPYLICGAMAAQILFWANRWLGWQTVMLT